MRPKKDYQVRLLIVSCILLNFIGKAFAENLQLPLWMDSFGTVIVAYLLGPICGALVGVASNVIYGMCYSMSYIYAIISVLIGVITGIAAKRKAFDTLFHTFSVSVILTLVTTLVSTLLNAYFYNGITGNIWGDGVIAYLREAGMPKWFYTIAGEFYIDFLDKVITLLSLYCLIKLVRICEKKHKNRKRKNLKYLSGVLLLMVLICGLANAPKASAKKVSDGGSNYNSYIQTRYGNENGLSCGTANDIAQTADGIIWIGTYAGLYRYNGSEFRWMGDYESIRNVNCLYLDPENRLWVGTNDNGLSILINDKIVNVIDKKNGLPSNSVRCIAESSDGDYYIGTTGSMQLLSLNSGLKTLNKIDDINYATSVATDEKGHVATVNSNGDLFLLKQRKIISKIVPDHSTETFNSCVFDEKGLLYVGTSQNHIYVYDVSTNKLVQKKVMKCKNLSQINSLTFTETNDLFVCADNGVGYFDPYGKYKTINMSKFNNSIDDMLVDYQGNLWFASSRMGLMRLCKSAFMNIYSKMGLEEKVVNSVTKWKGRLYFGTDTGLDIVDEKLEHSVKNKLTSYLKNVRIRCLTTDRKNNLWICTYGKGLLEVEPSGKIKTYKSKEGTFGNRVRLVLELSNGTIAAAGDSGISLIENGKVTKTFRYGEGLSNEMILTMVELPDGTILAGTDGGGMVTIKNNKIVHKLTTANGLSSGVILRTVADVEGKGVFIVTSNGLCYMDEEGNIRPLKNFPYFNNYDLWMDGKGKVFVLGSAGIYVVERDELISDKEGMKYELLNHNSGLSSAITANSWNYCDAEGNLYISCDSGVVRINLFRYYNTVRSYRMLLSSIRTNDAVYTVERGEAISIGRNIGRIEIFPEVLNYTTDDPYVSYYLEGFDKKPVIIKQSELSSIVYTNLPKGTYTFHLAVLNNKKNAILEERTYTINKEKEIYDNQWFRVYMLLVFILAIAWLTWFIVRTQVQRTINFQRKEIAFAKEQVRMGNETIIAIARTVDAKDEHTSKHSVRVSEYCVMIGNKLGFSEEECENLRRAALLHDIGKIGIVDKVLNKPSKLDDSEYEIMKSHVTRGAEILKDFTLVDHVIDGAMYHHERYDGKGYAKGLKGEEIPLYGRIICVADAFDAMTSNRVYRNKLNMQKVLGELERCRGTQFDPVIDDVFLDLIRNKELDLDSVLGQDLQEEER